MGLAKDIVKDNKKILLLTLGLFVVSILGVTLMNDNFLNLNSDIIQEDLYSKPNDVLQEGVDYKAIIRTEYGNIEVDLYEEQSPNAVNSFVFLSGENFYDGLTFHKVIPNFVIQAGDHLGNGKGDPGYTLEPDENQLEVTEYTMGMANASQFFIVTRGANTNDPDLQGFPLVGRVTKGFSVVDVIEKAPVGEDNRPVNDITINSVLIIEE